MAKSSLVSVSFSLLLFSSGAAHGDSFLSSDEAKSATQALLVACRATDSARCLDVRLDYDALSRAPLEAHKRSLGPARFERLRRAFTQLLVARARSAAQGLAKGRVLGDPDTAAPGCATIVIEDPEEELERRVTLVWHQVGDVAKISDVQIDGSSLLRDYKNQFARIVSKEGPDGLAKRILSKAGAPG